MARNVLIRLLFALALGTFAFGASGCLRVNFDRCDDDEPHPDCALIDGATPADADGQHDAGSPVDAGT